MKIKLKKDSIIILSGIPGSGKSTFANKYFKKEQILSLDYFRKLLGGVFYKENRLEPNQLVSGRVIKMVEQILEERANHGYLTVIDATNLDWQYIKSWKKIADKYGREILILFFDISEELAKNWNKKRKEEVSEKIIDVFIKKKEQFLNSPKVKELEKKGLFLYINPLKEYKFSYTPLSNKVVDINKEKVLIVGDIHGDLEAFNKFKQIAEKENAFLIFVGDVIDRGKDSLEVLLKIKNLVEKNRAILILGNHEYNLLRALNDEIEKLSFSTSLTYNKVILSDKKEEIKYFLYSLPKAVLLNKKYFISHSFLDIDPYKDNTFQYSDFSLTNNFGYESDKQINNSTDFILVYGHIFNGERKLKNMYNLADVHKDGDNIYYGLLIKNNLEELIEIKTRSEQLIRFGSGEEDLKKINKAFDFYLELLDFKKRNKNYLLHKVNGRFEIFKYSSKAFWDLNRINFYRTPLMYARGHVFDKYTYSFVTVPFFKFFNLNETPYDTFDYIIENIIPQSDRILITEKINGFLVNISRTFDDKILVTTSGSIESEMVDIAKKNLVRYIGSNWEDKIKRVLPRGYTLMTELVAPEDYFNHIVATPKQFGFHVLAYSYNYFMKHPKDARIVPVGLEESKNLTNKLEEIGFKIVNYEIKDATIENFEEELRKSLEIENKEGVVIYFLKNNKIIKPLKLKYKDYLIKKAIKRGFKNKLKFYENLNLGILKDNPFKNLFKELN